VSVEFLNYTAGSCATIQQLLLECDHKNFASWYPGGNDLSTSSFGDIAIVYTLHLRHFCWCFCCLPLIDRHRVVALYSFDQKLVWVRSIVLLFLSSRRPLVFIVKTPIPSSIAVLFLSWSRRCHDRCGPIDRCFCSHRRVVFVGYTPTPRSIELA
jgi:hypothetical protein